MKTRCSASPLPPAVYFPALLIPQISFPSSLRLATTSRILSTSLQPATSTFTFISPENGPCRALPDYKYPMSRPHLLLFLGLVCTVAARVIHVQTLQVPLSQQTVYTGPTHFRATSIILEMTESNGDATFVEIPLRERITPGALFRRLKSVKIVALVDVQEQAVALEELTKVVCRVVPVFSREEKSVNTATESAQRIWPSITAEDGTVRFDIYSSRWFLAGREIQSLECR
ncbi:hypothetical protein BCR34DRAFT_152758 [Clohesyomyces aquaticus]|uniref:Uncharacterized protein n=1 Tax=Clohesyomyces aquaticus TaxID=1231657 RepID=A0A1Y2A198_9PLEO|nr:hypothetical protein BCR34DRAFT_152758 [Clohesyomyces aquaticus]